MSTCMLNIAHISKLRNTSKELVDFILHSTRLQDRTGKCHGIYYKDTVTELGVCNQTFYNNMRQAEKLDLIKIYWDQMKTSQNDWDFRFADNNIRFSEDGEASPVCRCETHASPDEVLGEFEKVLPDSN